MLKNAVLVFALGATLAGCTGGSVFQDSKGSEPPEPAANERLSMEVPDQVDPGTMSAQRIKTTLSGKSWKWQSPKFSGVTLYADDGSSLVEVTGKGTTTGKWTVKDGQLCESFAPAPFLPKGQPMTCKPFSGAGSRYQVGQATFTLA